MYEKTYLCYLPTPYVYILKEKIFPGDMILEMLQLLKVPDEIVLDNRQVVLRVIGIRVLALAPLRQTLVIPVAHDGCPTGFSTTMPPIVGFRRGSPSIMSQG